MKRVVFFGTPAFSVPALRSLLKNKNFSVVGVVTQPDAPQGRKKILNSPPVKLVAQEYNTPVFQPKKLSHPDFVALFTLLKPDVCVVAAYGKIIPKVILDIPQFGMINIHPSALPLLRGASPLQYTILQGFKETALTIMLMDEGMDTGPIVYQHTAKVHADDTYDSLSNRMSAQAAQDLMYALPLYMSGELKPRKQDNALATYTKVLKKEDGLIDWSRTADEIDRKIRAFYPWPGAFFERMKDGTRIKIIQAHVGSDGVIVMPCGNNTFLTIDRLQPSGKKIMNADAFIRGYGSVL